MIRCDAEGLPTVVQSIAPALAGWRVQLFNNLVRFVDYTEVPPEACFEQTLTKVEKFVNNNLKDFLK